MTQNPTKIVCTLGPATSSSEMVRGLLEAGMDVARLNMSHGDYGTHAAAISLVRSLAAELGLHVALLMDLQGPRIRAGIMQGGAVELAAGATCVVATEAATGTAQRFSTTYGRLAHDVQVGDRILIDDGLLELRVTAFTETEVTCEVVRGGVLRDHKGINLPGVKVSEPSVTEKDLADLEFGLQAGVDYVALSFVRTADDIRVLKRAIAERGHTEPVVAKLERPEAIEQLEAIVEAADAVMVARGDLAVEASPEQVPILQKQIIAACARGRKPVITATQMLESMRENPQPTRAEASDVANAILDGTDAVMLSGETAAGKYPLESVRMMRRICEAAENSQLAGEHLQTRGLVGGVTDFANAVSEAAAVTAERIGAQAIVAFTQSGSTARLASKCRPRVPIIAVTPLPEAARRANLYWGVQPVVVDQAVDTDEAMRLIDSTLRERGLVASGQPVVITAGTPIAVRGTTNLMKLHIVGSPTA